LQEPPEDFQFGSKFGLHLLSEFLFLEQRRAIHLLSEKSLLATGFFFKVAELGGENANFGVKTNDLALCVLLRALCFNFFVDLTQLK
jgi:hypothetical protein